MSFYTAVSGLNSAQADLEVTSNNIANVNTIGFKNSRSEFGDLYSNILENPKTAVGNGTMLQAVTQQFDQGNLEFTSNSLDLGISGEGFFVVSPDSESTDQLFTRAGAFNINTDGYIVNSSGHYLQAFPVSTDGAVLSTTADSMARLQIPDVTGEPQPTSQIDMSLNLPAETTPLNISNFSPSEPTSYSASTGINVFDSLGTQHSASLYFVHDQTGDNKWAMYTAIDGDVVPLNDGVGGTVDYASMTFDSDGKLDLTSVTPREFQTVMLGTEANLTGWMSGVDPTQTITINLPANAPTQFASSFSVNTLDQNGFGIGRLTGINIDPTGLVSGAYTNGQSISVGKVALARFTNTQGLKQNGNTEWTATNDSGAALFGESGTASFGGIRSGALEQSNVNLTNDLIGLIKAQRNFQANAKSIEAVDKATETIITQS